MFTMCVFPLTQASGLFSSSWSLSADQPLPAGHILPNGVRAAGIALQVKAGGTS